MDSCTCSDLKNLMEPFRGINSTPCCHPWASLWLGRHCFRESTLSLSNAGLRPTGHLEGLSLLGQLSDCHHYEEILFSRRSAVHFVGLSSHRLRWHCPSSRQSVDDRSISLQTRKSLWSLLGIRNSLVVDNCLYFCSLFFSVLGFKVFDTR